jgi:hypothetical protein
VSKPQRGVADTCFCCAPLWLVGCGYSTHATPLWGFQILMRLL